MDKQKSHHFSICAETEIKLIFGSHIKLKCMVNSCCNATKKNVYGRLCAHFAKPNMQNKISTT